MPMFPRGSRPMWHSFMQPEAYYQHLTDEEEDAYAHHDYKGWSGPPRQHRSNVLGYRQPQTLYALDPYGRLVPVFGVTQGSLPQRHPSGRPPTASSRKCHVEEEDSTDDSLLQLLAKHLKMNAPHATHIPQSEHNNSDTEDQDPVSSLLRALQPHLVSRGLHPIASRSAHRVRPPSLNTDDDTLDNEVAYQGGDEAEGDGNHVYAHAKPTLAALMDALNLPPTRTSTASPAIPSHHRRSSSGRRRRMQRAPPPPPTSRTCNPHIISPTSDSIPDDQGAPPTSSWSGQSQHQQHQPKVLIPLRLVHTPSGCVRAVPAAGEVYHLGPHPSPLPISTPTPGDIHPSASRHAKLASCKEDEDNDSDCEQPQPSTPPASVKNPTVIKVIPAPDHCASTKPTSTITLASRDSSAPNLTPTPTHAPARTHGPIPAPAPIANPISTAVTANAATTDSTKQKAHAAPTATTATSAKPAAAVGNTSHSTSTARRVPVMVGSASRTTSPTSAQMPPQAGPTTVATTATAPSTTAATTTTAAAAAASNSTAAAATSKSAGVTAAAASHLASNNLTKSQAARVIQRYWRGWRLWGQKQTLTQLKKQQALVKAAWATFGQYMGETQDACSPHVHELRAVRKRLTQQALRLQDQVTAAWQESKCNPTNRSTSAPPADDIQLQSIDIMDPALTPTIPGAQEEASPSVSPSTIISTASTADIQPQAVSHSTPPSLAQGLDISVPPAQECYAATLLPVSTIDTSTEAVEKQPTSDDLAGKELPYLVTTTTAMDEGLASTVVGDACVPPAPPPTPQPSTQPLFPVPPALLLVPTPTLTQELLSLKPVQVQQSDLDDGHTSITPPSPSSPHRHDFFHSPLPSKAPSSPYVCPSHCEDGTQAHIQGEPMTDTQDIPAFISNDDTAVREGASTAATCMSDGHDADDAVFIDVEEACTNSDGSMISDVLGAGSTMSIDQPQGVSVPKGGYGAHKSGGVARSGGAPKGVRVRGSMNSARQAALARQLVHAALRDGVLVRGRGRRKATTNV